MCPFEGSPVLQNLDLHLHYGNVCPCYFGLRYVLLLLLTQLELESSSMLIGLAWREIIQFPQDNETGSCSSSFWLMIFSTVRESHPIRRPSPITETSPDQETKCPLIRRHIPRSRDRVKLSLVVQHQRQMCV